MGGNAISLQVTPVIFSSFLKSFPVPICTCGWKEAVNDNTMSCPRTQRGDPKSSRPKSNQRRVQSAIGYYHLITTTDLQCDNSGTLMLSYQLFDGYVLQIHDYVHFFLECISSVSHFLWLVIQIWSKRSSLKNFPSSTIEGWELQCNLFFISWFQ